jgi:hypothetical protein
LDVSRVNTGIVSFVGLAIIVKTGIVSNIGSKTMILENSSTEKDNDFLVSGVVRGYNCSRDLLDTGALMELSGLLLITPSWTRFRGARAVTFLV